MYQSYHNIIIVFKTWNISLGKNSLNTLWLSHTESVRTILKYFGQKWYQMGMRAGQEPLAKALNDTQANLWDLSLDTQINRPNFDCTS